MTTTRGPVSSGSSTTCRRSSRSSAWQRLSGALPRPSPWCREIPVRCSTGSTGAASRSESRRLDARELVHVAGPAGGATAADVAGPGWGGVSGRQYDELAAVLDVDRARHVIVLAFNVELRPAGAGSDVENLRPPLNTDRLGLLVERQGMAADHS